MMKAMVRFTGLLISLLLLINNGSFAHILGSDMAWSSLGGDSFLIKVSIFNDCNTVGLGNKSVNFKCISTGTSIATLSLTVPTPVDITPVCKNSCSRCTNPSCSFPYGVHRYIY
jgi:hypothetical protein